MWIPPFTQVTSLLNKTVSFLYVTTYLCINLRIIIKFHQMSLPSYLYIHVAVKIYLNFDLLAPEDMGLNPKVVNMLPGLENAKYEMVWMVDAGFLGT